MFYLRCSARDCGAALDLHDRALACPICSDLLEVTFESVNVDPASLKRLWQARRQSWEPENASGVWRYREVLPPYDLEVVTLGEGQHTIGTRETVRGLGWRQRPALQAFGVQSYRVF